MNNDNLKKMQEIIAQQQAQAAKKTILKSSPVKQPTPPAPAKTTPPAEQPKPTPAPVQPIASQELQAQINKGIYHTISLINNKTLVNEICSDFINVLDKIINELTNTAGAAAAIDLEYIRDAKSKIIALQIKATETATNQPQLSSMVFSDLVPETPVIVQETAPAVQEEPAEPNQLIKIVDYSPLSFAVIGKIKGDETKLFTDELSAAGGIFNPRLKCGAGWIFSKKHLHTVKEMFDL